MKSSLVNMVVVLLGITAVTSSAVGLVYRVTEAPIAQAKLHKKADALAQVLPPFDNTPADEMQAVAAGNDSVYVYTARMGQTVAGYAVESFASGFGGPIRIMVGFGPTAGYGTYRCWNRRRLRVSGRNSPRRAILSRQVFSAKVRRR